MEILKNLFNLILEFLNSRKVSQHKSEEVKRVEVDQAQKTQKALEDRKHEIITPKPPTDDNFFND